MLAEHFVYSAALAILVGMVFLKYTGRDNSWIIILVALAPDIDLIANRVLNWFGFNLLFEGHTISHGVFHNVAMMVIFGILVAFFLNPFGIKFFDGFFFSIIGFAAHLFEDALVYDPGYKFLWPFSSKVLGLGLLPNMLSEENYFRDFFGIANTEVLVIGMVFLLAAIIIRTYGEGPAWIRGYMPGVVYENLFGKKTESP
jgi:uncharacterized membrane protein